MKIGISGKGGVGKTTISGALCRMLGRKGRNVLAIDGDPNPNLAVVLGIKDHRDGLSQPPLSTDLLERIEDNGSTHVRLGVSLDEALATYGVEAPDNVTLLEVGKPEHAGSGCMCGSHAVVREIIRAAVADSPDHVTVLDMEASLEHMKRGTSKYVDALYVVVEPYYRSLETAKRIHELGRELGIEKIAAVGNKVRTGEDEQAIREFCERNSLPLSTMVPFDQNFIQAEREGKAVADVNGDSPGLREISRLADEITAG